MTLSVEAAYPRPSGPESGQVRSHPKPLLLTQYYHAMLSPGLDLALEAHIDRCPQCRDILSAADAGEIARLPQGDEAPLPDETLVQSLAQSLERIDALEAGSPRARPEPRWPKWLQAIALPNTMDPATVGRRHWPAPGVWIAPVALDGETRGARTYLISVKAGIAVPQHSHAGREITVVLSGNLADEGGVYGPGNLMDCDGSHSHAPAAATDCVCLVAAEAPVVMQTWIGRLIQPLAGI